MIIDVETTVVALELQHAGIKVDGLYGFKNDGKVVGWFQGHIEFGSRALGNRSILANPTFVISPTIPIVLP